MINDNKPHARYLRHPFLIIFLWVLAVSCVKPAPGDEGTHPNIIFILSDDHAYQAISAYGSTLIETPNIDRIAAEGMRFDRAFVTNSICAPSRAVILTGKFSHLNGVPGNGQVFDGNQQTFPKLLQQHGYQTALIGKWHLKSHPTGFDYWNVLPGQGDYYNPDFIQQGVDTVYPGYVTDIITGLSIDWLEKRDQKKPFCLLMQHKAPHRSWMPAIQHLELFDEQAFPLPGNFYDDYAGKEALKVQKLTVRDHMDIRMDFKVPCDTCDTVSVNSWAPGEYWRRLERLSPLERQQWEAAYKKEEDAFYRVKEDEQAFDRWKFRRYMEDYLRCIVSVDESVGKLLDYLEKSGLDEQTLVVYTSDQGFFLGEHGLFDKRFMYEEAMRTPLLIRYPKEIKPKTQTRRLTQNLDMAPTLLDVAGIPVPADMQGESLRKIWLHADEAWREAIYYHYYEKGFGASPHYGIRTDRYKLIHFYDVVDAWEFYDLKADPHEMQNVYTNPEYAQIIQEMKDKLTALQQTYTDVL